MKYNFADPEHFKALEKQAYDGTIDVSEFPPAAYRYFDSLQKLYYKYRYNEIGRQEAEAKKRRLLSQYNETISAYENYRSVYSTEQHNIRTLNTRLSDIEKAQTAEEIALLACECIQILTGEFEFLKRQKKKIIKEDKNNA